MPNPTDYPIRFLLVSLPTFWFSAWIGASWRRRHGIAKEEDRAFFNIILSASLTLLGLIIAFSFSMAVSRYDQRKNYEEQEANAIGAEYARVNLLPPPDAVKVHALLKSYLDQRILYYETRNENEIPQINTRIAQMQTDLWSAASTSLTSMPAPIATFVLGGMNDVLNSQEYTQAAWWNRIPLPAWMLLITISILCNLLLGFDSVGRHAFFLLILPIVLSICFFLIAEIDSPRHGIIRVQPQNLVSLAESLHSE
jgi:hypothetical protein